MDPLMIVALIAGVPLVLALALRVSSVYLFASIAAGGLLLEYLSEDVSLTVNTFLKDKDPSMVVHSVLLLLPVLLTMFFLRKTLKTSKLLVELLPLLASIAMLLILVVSQLPKDLQTQISAAPYGKIIRQSEHVVIGAAVLLNLGLMWLLNRKKPEESGRGHHKKH